MVTAEQVGSEFALKFGDRVRALRKERGVKQKALADMLGYKSHTAIVHMEAGLQAPTLEMTLQIARVFQVSLRELLGKELLGDLLFIEGSDLPADRQAAASRCLKEVTQLHSAFTEKFQQFTSLVAS